MPYLSQYIISTVDTYWASFLHCSPESLTVHGTHVLVRPSTITWRGVYFFHRQHTLLISIPPDEFDNHPASLEQLTPDDIQDTSYLRGIVGGGRDQVLGPSFVGYASTTTLRPLGGAGVRQLDADDHAELDRLRLACGELAWTHSGCSPGMQPVVGAFVEHTLVAAASYARWNSHIAHISAITHPGYRGRRYGKVVVSAIAMLILERGLIPQYRTRHSNDAALAIGQTLGFEQYATTVVVQYGD